MSHSFFSQDFTATQPFDAGGITATQLGSQVDFSFLDFSTQDVPGFTEFPEFQDFAKVGAWHVTAACDPAGPCCPATLPTLCAGQQAAAPQPQERDTPQVQLL